MRVVANIQIFREQQLRCLRSKASDCRETYRREKCER